MWQNSPRLNNSTFRTTHRKRTSCGPQDHHQNIHDTKFRFLLGSNLTMSNTITQASQHYLDVSVLNLPLRIIQSCKKWLGLLILKKVLLNCLMKITL